MLAWSAGRCAASCAAYAGADLLPMEIDKIIRSRRKTIALIIEPDGRLVVRAPLRLPERQIHDLVERKAGWIVRKQDQIRQAGSTLQTHAYSEGEELLYLGKPYRLILVPNPAPPLCLEDSFYLSAALRGRGKEVFTAWYRNQAARILSERVRLFAGSMQLSFHQVKITSARTRWGSCSAQGNLCFTWRLVMAPLPIIDYVVVHELAHLLQRNHSHAYWEIVAKVLPDYRQRRGWLKANGRLLTLD
ncbi:MAG: M48 family metallopeptidase [Chloroflexi bacterium]|nr:M48 family metallopeptidase [Chloroflexota bacterium]